MKKYIENLKKFNFYANCQCEKKMKIYILLQKLDVRIMS